jgi:hypothetical protein
LNSSCNFEKKTVQNRKQSKASNRNEDKNENEKRDTKEVENFSMPKYRLKHYIPSIG